MVIYGGFDGVYKNDVWALSLTSPPSWTEITPVLAGPAARAGHAAIYDPVAQKMVVFAGSSAAGAKQDVWTLSLAGTPSWSLLATSGAPPSPRSAASAIYDPLAARMVVFGGTPATNDVWMLSLGSSAGWTHPIPAGTPPTPRGGHTAIYDPLNSRMLVYGGGAGSLLSGETWSLSLGASPAWSLITATGSASVTARQFHTAAYDAGSQRMLVYGGQSSAGLRADVWGLALQGNPAWSELTPTTGPSPGARSGITGVIDPGSGDWYVFGGALGSGTFEADLWRLQMMVQADTCRRGDADWVYVNSLGPAARTLHAMATDEARGTVVLFGGIVNGAAMGDTWEWDGDSWHYRSPLHRPSPRGSHAMAYDPLRQRVVLYGGSTNSSQYADTWEWDGSDWHQVLAAGPGFRYGHAMAWDDSLKEVVLFGGFDGSVRSDLWSWNGSTWTPRAVTGPSGGLYAAMANDPQRRRVVLFGGRVTASPASAVDETWEWDGGSWSAIAPLTRPGARSNAGMSYSACCNRVTLMGGQGVNPLGSTWVWDGYDWRADSAALGERVSGAMTYDIAQSRLMFFGGYDPSIALDSRFTHELCCPCDNETALLDSAGNVIFPPATDPLALPVYTTVDTLNGDVADLYPGFHTSSDTWYPNLACDPAIGGTVPPEAALPAFGDSLAALGINASWQEIADSLAAWGEQIRDSVASQADGLLGALPVGPAAPYVAPAEPYCPPRPDFAHNYRYVFGGRDIVFVHGLKVEHVLNKMTLADPRALTKWHHPNTFPGSTDNPEFYNTGGYFRDIAAVNWSLHIQQFLVARGIANRVLVVSYPCGERLEVGVQAVLTQISDAMRYGVNVADLTGRGYTGKFGTPSFVMISHSTGGLLTDAALWSAQTYPNLQAKFIADRCKAHIAMTCAFGGSDEATAGVVLSGVAGTISPWLCPLVRTMLPLISDNAAQVALPPCPMLFSTAATSVLVDLVPAVAKWKWGSAVDHTNVPTVMLTGAHPSKVYPFKTILLPGFDDGVLSINCQTANPNPPNLWPSGFIVRGGVLGKALTFDMGTAVHQPLRAAYYYSDQVIEGALFHPAIPNFIASGPVPYLSPTGMIQSVGFEFPIPTGFSPMARHNMHYSYISSAADHFVWRKGTNSPDYDDTWHERNFEETRTILQGDEPALYANYFPPGPVHTPGDDEPLLTAGCLPEVEEREDGIHVQFPLKSLTKLHAKKLWLWKRKYHLLKGFQMKMASDYMYESILNSECSGYVRNCVPSATVGVESSQGRSFMAQGYPNPMRGGMTIDFSLPVAGPVRLVIVDVAGRRVRTLAEGVMQAGAHGAYWNGTNDRGDDIAPGLYFWNLSAPGHHAVKKVMLVR